MPELILASTSPYRRELLQRLGLPFDVLSPEVDEQPQPGESPRATALRLARAKASSGAAMAAAAGRDALVIGSDQTASLDGSTVVGKPGSHERARAQLLAAAGRTMHFHTAFALAGSDGRIIDAGEVPTRVRFRMLDEATVDAYLHAERPYDCAGSAKAEGLGLTLIEAVESPDPTALIGLPLIAVTSALCRAGLPPLPGLGAGRPDGRRSEPPTTAPGVLPTRPGTLHRPGALHHPGTLHLIPTPLGADSNPSRVLPADTLATVARLRHFVVENAKTARAFLKAAGTGLPLQALQLAELNVHTPPAAIAGLLAPLLAGEDVGLLSEAGCPAVADPGAALVAAAHDAGIPVVPQVGPSAVLLALMASGLNGQRFSFVGYLPAQADARIARLRELERRSASGDETILWIETPYRNQQMLDSALGCLSGETRLAVASELTLGAESVSSHRVADWRRRPPAIPREPTVFALLADRVSVSAAPSSQPARRPAPGRGSRRR